MNIKTNQLLSVLLWGTGMYTLQVFINVPNQRLSILFSLLLALIILKVNIFFIKDRLYCHKFWGYTLPLLIMNGVLLPFNLLAAHLNHFTFKPIDYFYYFVFNLLIFMIYWLQHQYFKKKINQQLKIKIHRLK